VSKTPRQHREEIDRWIKSRRDEEARNRDWSILAVGGVLFGLLAVLILHDLGMLDLITKAASGH
jgi:hypothetical protein